MKRIIIGLVLALASAQTANADVYVKVDAQGNAIGGAIMCDAATCGAGSAYSQATLGIGERYVLQGVGVHHGIGNNNPNTAVKHETATNEWVISTTQPAPVAQPSTPAPEPTVTVQRFTVITPEPTPVVQGAVQVQRSDTATVTTKTDTATITTETTTAVIDTATALVDTATTTSFFDEELDLTWDWDKILAWIVAWFEKIWIRL
jgi:hypothetical protein